MAEKSSSNETVMAPESETEPEIENEKETDESNITLLSSPMKDWLLGTDIECYSWSYVKDDMTFMPYIRMPEDKIAEVPETAVESVKYLFTYDGVKMLIHTSSSNKPLKKYVKDEYVENLQYYIYEEAENYYIEAYSNQGVGRIIVSDWNTSYEIRIYQNHSYDEHHEASDRIDNTVMSYVTDSTEYIINQMESGTAAANVGPVVTEDKTASGVSEIDYNNIAEIDIDGIYGMYQHTDNTHAIAIGIEYYTDDWAGLLM